MPTFYPDPPPSPNDDWRKSQQPPPLVDPAYPDEDDWESPFAKKVDENAPVTYRGAASDPVFGYLIAVALSIGLMPLIPTDPALRYTLVWAVMGGFGVLAWLLGNSGRIWMDTPENLGWGIVFGLILGVPFVLFGGNTLQQTAQRIFTGMKPGETLAFLIFVMPTAETLFFRGVLQETRRFWLVGILGAIWSMLVFFPMIDAPRYPAVALIIGTALVLMNFMYCYVRQRNGLAAAWLCQIVASLVLLFLPLL
ncbi:MAG: hypothetical protein ABI970_14045 [Chloroflexota bacterium]|nr:hypothetical protein [Anaerolineae bacterium]